MTVQTFYRCAVWLPMLLPAIVAIAFHGLGWQPVSSAALKFVQLMLMSGGYGGVPYLVLAGYASWWIGGRSELQIRRRALQAPLWMLLLWLPFAAVLGALSGTIKVFLGLAGLGTVVIIPLGYAYVVIVFLLRRLMGRVESRGPTANVHSPAR
jgi:hypothetical protein